MCELPVKRKKKKKNHVSQLLKKSLGNTPRVYSVPASIDLIPEMKHLGWGKGVCLGTTLPVS